MLVQSHNVALHLQIRWFYVAILLGTHRTDASKIFKFHFFRVQMFISHSPGDKSLGKWLLRRTNVLPADSTLPFYFLNFAPIDNGDSPLKGKNLLLWKQNGNLLLWKQFLSFKKAHHVGKDASSGKHTWSDKRLSPFVNKSFTGGAWYARFSTME